MYRYAIARSPGPNLATGITTSELGKPDYETALRQHQRYVDALRDAGLAVAILDPLPGHPDGHFVEDVAVVTPEIAVITRPGAEARRGEEGALEPVLTQYRRIVRISAPGTLDGGDVLIVGRQVIIGISQRTNVEGARQLGAILAPFGYAWKTVSVDVGLHLKSSVNVMEEDTLLTADWLNRARQVGSGRPPFGGYRRIVVDDVDAYAANSLWVNDRILMPAGFPRVRDQLEVLGRQVVEVDVSEMRKMDGGITCMSVRL
jgi:dimethylargininase